MTNPGSLSDGLVKLEQIVRPLEWQPTETDAELASTICGVYSVFVCLDDERGEWWEAYSGSGYLSAWSTCDEAKAAAEADYRARIASALNLDPILSEIKRMREALAWYGERSASLAKTMAGQQLEAMTGKDANYVIAILTELSLDAGRRALPTPPQDPTNDRK